MGWSPECWGCVRTEAKPSNKTFTPSDRDIRPKRRTKHIKEQVADLDAELTIERTIGFINCDCDIMLRKHLSL